MFILSDNPDFPTNRDNFYTVKTQCHNCAASAEGLIATGKPIQDYLMIPYVNYARGLKCAHCGCDSVYPQKPYIRTL